MAPWSLAFLRSINSCPRVGLHTTVAGLSPPICQAQPEPRTPRALAAAINHMNLDNLVFIVIPSQLSNCQAHWPRSCVTSAILPERKCEPFAPNGKRHIG